MSDLTERRGGLARLRLALAELEPAELAEALADVDALALARVSHARVPWDGGLDGNFDGGACYECDPDSAARGPARARSCGVYGPAFCVDCCERHACPGSVLL